jgi:hypothetical protein
MNSGLTAKGKPRDRLSDLPAQDVAEHLFGRTWQYGAAQDDGQRTFAPLEAASDVGANAHEAIEIRMSSSFVRRADTDERNVRFAEGVVG